MSGFLYLMRSVNKNNLSNLNSFISFCSMKLLFQGRETLVPRGRNFCFNKVKLNRAQS